MRPSPVTVLFAGLVVSSMPERPSVPFHATSTSPLYQPAPFASVVALPARVGLVLSMLTPVTLEVLALPSASWPAPSFLGVMTSWHEAIPDSSSLHTKLASTSLLFQPKEFAAGLRVPVMVGAIPSIFT